MSGPAFQLEGYTIRREVMPAILSNGTCMSQVPGRMVPPRARCVTIQLGDRPMYDLRNGCNWAVAAAAGALVADLLLARQLSANSQKQATSCSQQQQQPTCWPASQPAKLYATSPPAPLHSGCEVKFMAHRSQAPTTIHRGGGGG